MKKRILILTCIMLALGAGCSTNQNDNPNNQNNEVSNNQGSNNDDSNGNNLNANTNNENQGNQVTPTPTKEGEQNTARPTPIPMEAVTPEPTEEPTSTPTPTPEVTPTVTPTVQPTKEPTPEPTEEPDEPEYTYTKKNATMYSNASLNVRDLPSKEGKIVGALEKGDEVKVTGVCNETDWYRISYEGKDAYVSSDYLTSRKPPQPTVTPTATPTPTPKPTQVPTPEPTKEPENTSAYTYTKMNAIVYSGASLHIRNLPSKEGKVIGGLKKGEEVKVIARCNETGWYQISYGNQKAYVSSEYMTSEKPGTVETTPTPTPTLMPTAVPTVTPKPTEEPNQSTETPFYTYTVKNVTMYTKSSVYVRNLPSSKGDVLDGFVKNQKVKVTGVCNETGWYRIDYNGSAGYISGGYLVNEAIED